MSGFNLPPGVSVNDIPGNEADPILYDYDGLVNGKSVTFELHESGVFLVNGEPQPWYEDSKTGKPWIVAKRRTFVSLVKQAIREGDFD